MAFMKEQKMKEQSEREWQLALQESILRILDLFNLVGKAFDEMRLRIDALEKHVYSDKK